MSSQNSETRFYRHLPVLGCIADVLRFRAANHRESLLQTRHNIFGFIEAKRCLGEVGDVRRIVDCQCVHIRDRFDKNHLRWRLPQCADHFVVVLVSDQHDGIAFARELDCLEMHFSH